MLRAARQISQLCIIDEETAASDENERQLYASPQQYKFILLLLTHHYLQKQIWYLRNLPSEDGVMSLSPWINDQDVVVVVVIHGSRNIYWKWWYGGWEKMQLCFRHPLHKKKKRYIWRIQQGRKTLEENFLAFLFSYFYCSLSPHYGWTAQLVCL